MQTELPLDLISSRSVKYSHSSGFSNASTGEMNLAFFDRAIVPRWKRQKRHYAHFVPFVACDRGYTNTNVLSLASRLSGQFSWGTFLISWGTLREL